MQFALRHPDRCTALVLVSAICRPWSPVPLDALKWRPYADLALWAVLTWAPQAIFSALGVNRQTLSQLALEDRAWLYQACQTLLPFDLRWAGAKNDAIQLAQLEDYPLHRITAPTLVIHAADDNLVPFADGQFAAKSIPGARLLALDAGGHLLLGRREELATAIAGFVSERVGGDEG